MVGRVQHKTGNAKNYFLTLSGGNSVKRHTIFGRGILWPKSVTKLKNPVAWQLCSLSFLNNSTCTCIALELHCKFELLCVCMCMCVCCAVYKCVCGHMYMCMCKVHGIPLDISLTNGPCQVISRYLPHPHILCWSVGFSKLIKQAFYEKWGMVLGH